MPLITPWAVFLCAGFYMLLTLQVIRARRETGIALGDDGNALMQRRMRGQANAAEQMPLTLLAIAMAEILGGASPILALSSAVFIAGRIAHGIAFGWLTHSPPLRFWGMAASLLGSVAILAHLGLLLIRYSFS